MQESKLGNLIDGDAERDAVHVAIAPVEAAEVLYPGMHVGLDESGKATTKASHIGVVDPFYMGTIYPQRRFYLCLYPGSIVSLTHQWSHPAFSEPPKADKENSVRWLKDYAAKMDLTFDELIDGARQYLTSGRYIIDGGRYEGEYVPDEFWPHFEVATDTHVPTENRGSFFSCSC